MLWDCACAADAAGHLQGQQAEQARWKIQEAVDQVSASFWSAACIVLHWGCSLVEPLWSGTSRVSICRCWKGGSDMAGRPSTACRCLHSRTAAEQGPAACTAGQEHVQDGRQAQHCAQVPARSHSC